MVRLTVPPGSVSEAVKVTIQGIGAPPEDVGFVPGTVYDFGPEGTTFDPPATLTLTYDEADVTPGSDEEDLTLLTDTADDEWEEIEGATVDPTTNTVTGEIAGFSRKGIGAFVASVEIAPSTIEIEIDEIETLETVLRSKIGTVLRFRQLTWSSSNEGVARVSPRPLGRGMVVGNTPGTATITATASTGVSSSIVVTVVPPSVEILTESLPNGAPNVPYIFDLDATGGDGDYTWSVSSGSLPAGLSLNASTGRISGTPTGSTSSFTVRVESGDGQSDTRRFTLTINPLLAVSTSSLPDGAVGTAYSQQVKAEGGDGEYTWAIASGALPRGLSLNSETGIISGTPTGSTSSFTVRVESGDGQSAARQLTITIAAFATLEITTESLENGAVGVAYSQTLTAAGGGGSYTWSIASGALPAGLSLDGATGEISGTPTGSGGTFTVQVESGDGQTASKELTISVNEGLTITTTSLPDGAVGTEYSQTLAATGGDGTYTWSIAAGALPAGLSLDSATGGISGTPSGTGSTFTVRADSGDGQTAEQELTLTIAAFPTLEITTTALADGTEGVAYSQMLAATGGDGSYTWSITAGALPAGLSLDGVTGEMSGTPTGTGSTFTVQVESRDGQTATKELTITIAAAVQVTTTSLPDATVSRAYSQSLSATGGDGSYTWSITAGTLPGGLSLDGASGVISGTPTAEETADFTVQVESAGQTDDQALSITVAAPPPAGSLSLGDLVSGSIDVAGESDFFTYSGTAGDIIVLTLVETPQWPGSSVDAQLTLFNAASMPRGTSCCSSTRTANRRTPCPRPARSRSGSWPTTSRAPAPTRSGSRVSLRSRRVRPRSGWVISYRDRSVMRRKRTSSPTPAPQVTSSC
jgi:hypothetical protein